MIHEICVQKYTHTHTCTHHNILLPIYRRQSKIVIQLELEIESRHLEMVDMLNTHNLPLHRRGSVPISVIGIVS